MKNRDTQLAWHYHDLTKHSYLSIRTSPHYLDWANMPLPFKIFPDLKPVALPQVMPSVNAPALDSLAYGPVADGTVLPSLGRLTSLLYYSAGVTKKKSYPGGTLYFRAAACAGALYPIETYVVCRDIEGLSAGVYHFNPGDFSLRRLREGDWRGALVRAAAGESTVAEAPVTLVYTAISWRSSWKYRDRAYRYHYWDLGMILANALAIAGGQDMTVRVVMGFVDGEINRILGIDGKHELPLAMLSLGNGDSVPAATDDVPALQLPTVPLSDSEVDYPSILEAHDASSLTSIEEVLEWRSRSGILNQRPETSPLRDEKAPLDAKTLISVLPQRESDGGRDSLEQVIIRRGSTRRFARKALPFGDLSTILDRATDRYPGDVAGDELLNKLYLIVNQVDGLPSGSYFYRRREGALEPLKSGDFSDRAAYLSLDQSLGGDAAVTVFFMADLESILDRYGNRGYRLAHLDAGVTGGRMYLASYALKRGATGLTFYDDDVTGFFSPHAKGMSCILVMALGIPGKKPLY